MSYIPNHDQGCKLDISFLTTCRHCGEEVRFIRCTCRPRPSRFYLHPSGTRHDGRELSKADLRVHQHECDQMRDDARKSISDLHRRMGALDILREIGREQEVGGDKPPENPSQHARTERCKDFMREALMELRVKELQDQGKDRDVIKETIQREMDSLKANRSETGIGSEPEVESERSPFVVQLGPFNGARAHETVHELCRRGFNRARVDRVKTDQPGKFRVRIVGFQDCNAANDVRDELAGLGYPGAEVIPKPHEPFILW